MCSLSRPLSSAAFMARPFWHSRWRGNWITKEDDWQSDPPPGRFVSYFVCCKRHHSHTSVCVCVCVCLFVCGSVGGGGGRVCIHALLRVCLCVYSEVIFKDSFCLCRCAPVWHWHQIWTIHIMKSRHKFVLQQTPKFQTRFSREKSEKVAADYLCALCFSNNGDRVLMW